MVTSRELGPPAELMGGSAKANHSASQRSDLTRALASPRSNGLLTACLSRLSWYVRQSTNLTKLHRGSFSGSGGAATSFVCLARVQLSGHSGEGEEAAGERENGHNGRGAGEDRGGVRDWQGSAGETKRQRTARRKADASGGANHRRRCCPDVTARILRRCSWLCSLQRAFPSRWGLVGCCITYV